MHEMSLEEAARFLGMSPDGVRKRIRTGREAVEEGREVPSTAIHPERVRRDDRGRLFVAVTEADRRMVTEDADPREVEIARLRAEVDTLRRYLDTMERVVEDRGKAIAALSRQQDGLYRLLQVLTTNRPCLVENALTSGSITVLPSSS